MKYDPEKKAALPDGWLDCRASAPTNHETLNQWWFNAGSSYKTQAEH